MKYIRLILILLIVHCSTFIVNCQTDSTKLLFKVILKDGGVFNGSTKNVQLYVITDFGRIKLFLWDIDSVDIGILPDFRREMKIVKLLTKLNTESKNSRIFMYNKMLSLNLGALPIIRNYINLKPHANLNHDPSDILTPENLLKDLMHKYQVDSSFVDKDVIYMKQFKLEGFLTVKKKRALIRLDNYTFPRDEIKKIIILHKKKGDAK